MTSAEISLQLTIADQHDMLPGQIAVHMAYDPGTRSVLIRGHGFEASRVGAETLQAFLEDMAGALQDELNDTTDKHEVRVPRAEPRPGRLFNPQPMPKQ